jgi:hypothetical protein
MPKRLAQELHMPHKIELLTAHFFQYAKMSHPYILVNPQTPKQFAALVQFLKQIECPFKVPEDQHFDTSHLCANHDMLDRTIQEGFYTGLLTEDDAKFLGQDAQCYTTERVICGVHHFKVPKDTRDFWGAEFLNKDSFITVEGAMDRLTTYVKVHSLLLPYNTGFHTNEELRNILRTDKTTIYFTELVVVLAAMN